MPAAAKKKSPARRPAKPRSPASEAQTRPAARSRAAASQPFLRFYISEELRARTLSVLTAVEKARKPGQHRDELIDVVVALNEAGSSYFFLRPLKLSKAGFATEQLVNVSLAANQRLVASAIRTAMGRMDDRHLVYVGQYIRQLMA